MPTDNSSNQTVTDAMSNIVPSTTLEPTVRYKKQSHIVFVDGISRYKNRYDAMLEWTTDDRIRLLAQKDGTTVQIFDCSPRDVTRFSTGLNVGIFKIKGVGRISIDFVPSSIERDFSELGSSDEFGANSLNQLDDYLHGGPMPRDVGDLNWWIKNLKIYGVGGFLMTPRKVKNLSILTTVIILLIIATLTVVSVLTKT